MGYDPYKSNSEKKGKGNKFFTFDWQGAKPEFYKIKEGGDYRIDIIPFRIATKHHPAVREGASIGDEVYSLDYWVHRNVGPSGAAVVCPAETLGMRCPICEEAEKAKRENGFKSPEYNALKPKHRVVYNVVDPDDEDEKIKIFEESFALFEQELIKFSAARGRKKGKDFIHFADVSEGWTVEFTAEENSFEKSKFFKYNSWNLDERDKPHSKKIIDEAYQLDKYLILKSYEELQALLYGEGADEDEEGDEDEAPPAKEERTKCPNGRTYGKDFDRHEAVCEDCEIWQECKKLTRESAE